MVWVELTATIFGLLCVFLTVRQNIWCWPTGLVQVVLFIFVFYRVKLYSDLILHAIYVVMQIYGWYHWLHGAAGRRQLAVSRQSLSANALWAAAAVAASLAWGYVMAKNTDAALPYWDAFIIVASLIAQWLMARKKLESWFFWISVDIVAIGVYLSKSLFITTGLYTVFLFLALSGYFEWRKSLDVRETVPAL